jgi:hypothetical protein
MTTLNHITINIILHKIGLIQSSSAAENSEYTLKYRTEYGYTIQAIYVPKHGQPCHHPHSFHHQRVCSINKNQRKVIANALNAIITNYKDGDKI